MKKKTKEIQKKYFSDFEGIVFSHINKKLGRSTIVANLTSAENCPSCKLGFCKLSKICYAKKCERIYPNYKRKNLIVEDWMEKASATDILDLLEAYIEDYEEEREN